MASADEDAIPLRALLRCLVRCSRKAAEIAQIFRSEENDLFELLVEEKSQVEKNKRFFQDFKTLADVLVQETIKRDVGEQFPSLFSNIQGEEQNSFQNSLGESIRVELTSRPDETAALLSKVLDGRDHIARSLATAVHANATTTQDEEESTRYDSACTIPANTIGIWIDPIDSTAEYIQAKKESEDHGIQPYGLKCVCVLIGAYDLQSGDAILGVVNQPFYHKDLNSSKWDCRVYWAIHYESERATSPTLPRPPPSEQHEKKIAVLSSTEEKALQDVVASRYRIVHTAGAGYKSLLVALGQADLYVLSHGTTYYWDTCGPQAILAALGGGMVRFVDVVGGAAAADSAALRDKQIKYVAAADRTGIEAFRNVGGIVAYRDPSDADELIRLLRDAGYDRHK